MNEAAEMNESKGNGMDSVKADFSDPAVGRMVDNAWAEAMLPEAERERRRMNALAWLRNQRH